MGIGELKYRHSLCRSVMGEYYFLPQRGHLGILEPMGPKVSPGRDTGVGSLLRRSSQPRTQTPGLLIAGRFTTGYFPSSLTFPNVEERVLRKPSSEVLKRF